MSLFILSGTNYMEPTSSTHQSPGEVASNTVTSNISACVNSWTQNSFNVAQQTPNWFTPHSQHSPTGGSVTDRTPADKIPSSAETLPNHHYANEIWTRGDTAAAASVPTVPSETSHPTSSSSPSVMEEDSTANPILRRTTGSAPPLVELSVLMGDSLGPQRIDNYVTGRFLSGGGGAADAEGGNAHRLWRLPPPMSSRSASLGPPRDTALSQPLSEWSGPLAVLPATSAPAVSSLLEELPLQKIPASPASGGMCSTSSGSLVGRSPRVTVFRAPSKSRGGQLSPMGSYPQPNGSQPLQPVAPPGRRLDSPQRGVLNHRQSGWPRSAMASLMGSGPATPLLPTSRSIAADATPNVQNVEHLPLAVPPTPPGSPARSPRSWQRLLPPVATTPLAPILSSTPTVRPPSPLHSTEMCPPGVADREPFMRRQESHRVPSKSPATPGSGGIGVCQSPPLLHSTLVLPADSGSPVGQCIDPKLEEPKMAPPSATTSAPTRTTIVPSSVIVENTTALLAGSLIEGLQDLDPLDQGQALATAPLVRCASRLSLSSHIGVEGEDEDVGTHSQVIEDSGPTPLRMAMAMPMTLPSPKITTPQRRWEAPAKTTRPPPRIGSSRGESERSTSGPAQLHSGTHLHSSASPLSRAVTVNPSQPSSMAVTPTPSLFQQTSSHARGATENNQSHSNIFLPSGQSRRDRSKMLRPDTSLNSTRALPVRGSPLLPSPLVDELQGSAFPQATEGEGSFHSDTARMGLPIVTEGTTRSHTVPVMGSMQASRYHSAANLCRSSESSEVGLIETHHMLGDTQGNLGFTMNSVAASSVNKRTSAFSSLQYSMRHRQRRNVDNASRQLHRRSDPKGDDGTGEATALSRAGTLMATGASMMFDGLSNYEVTGTSADRNDGETMEAHLAALEAETTPNRAVGMWETVEHVFLPTYDVLAGGVTPQEAMLRDLHQHAGEMSPKKEGSSPISILVKDTVTVTGSGTRTEGSDHPPGLTVTVTGSPLALGSGSSAMGYRREPPTSPNHHVHPDAYSMGKVAPNYYVEPEQEDSLADCKTAARLLFDADYGVMLLGPQDEVERYTRRLTPADAAGADEGEDGACNCSEDIITKDYRGMDCNRYHTHQLFDHCEKCKRRPASFLCMHCLEAVCPSHVRYHYQLNPSQCTLFVNLLDIMTSFDRIFWCERCQRFTWKYTEIHDPFVDQLAVTRGTYVGEAVRDIHCVGWEVSLRDSRWHAATPPSPHSAPHSFRLPTALTDAARSPVSPVFLTPASSSPNPRLGGMPSEHAGQPNSPRALNDLVIGGGHPVLPVGEALTKLTAIGASVQGWRSTQEDAETAFLVDIPAPKGDKMVAKSRQGTTTTSSVEAHPTGFTHSVAAPVSPVALEQRDGAAPLPPEGGEETTIPMAVFCVFDGHGGDAVAKLAAGHFEQHLRQAIARVRPDDVKARALLMLVNAESCSPKIRPVSRTGSAMEAGDGVHPNNTSLCSLENSKIGASPSVVTAAGCVPLSVGASPMRGVSLPVPGVVTDEESGDSLPQVMPITSTSLAQHVAASEEQWHQQQSLISRRQSASDAPLPSMTANTLLHAWQDFGVGSDPHHRFRDSVTMASLGTVVSVTEVEMLRSYFASIMEDAFLSLDDYLLHTEEGERGDYNCVGCTACVVGITSTFILCANVGDSGACLYTAAGMQPISIKHRLTDSVEQQRIKAAGYNIINNRIEGLLAVSRAIGDFDFKQCGGRSAKEQAVTALPQVTIHTVPHSCASRPPGGGSSRWGIILACDGVWDTATLRQVHYALINTPSDLDVASSATEAVLRATELLHHHQRGPSKFLSDTPHGGAARSAAPPCSAMLPPAEEPAAAREAGASRPGGVSGSSGDDDDTPLSFCNGKDHPPLPTDPLMNASFVEDFGVEHPAASGLDARLLTAAAGIFAQCVAPKDNEEGIGLDNCSVIIIEPCL